MSDVRIHCCVPFCNRTHKPKGIGAEWICAEHWRLVGKRTRKLLHAYHRRVRRLANEFDPKGKGVIDLTVRAERVWERCKREAIEGAAGL